MVGKARRLDESQLLQWYYHVVHMYVGGTWPSLSC